MGYTKIVFENEDLDLLEIEVSNWKANNPVRIISETITINSVYKDTIIYK